MSECAQRDIEAIEVVRWGRVIRNEAVVPLVVCGDDGAVVEPINRFLTDFVAQGNRSSSVRSYAYDLLRWWRWLRAVEVEWNQATSAECRDLVLWLLKTRKIRDWPRTKSVDTAGTVNAITRKQYLDDRYAARTIRHSNAVVRAFYEFWIDQGEGPVINPVPLARRDTRANAHHNPLELFRKEGRIRYNPKVPIRRPRAIPDARWHELFMALGSNRDRALLALVVSNGVRAAEILGLRMIDVDWGDQLIRVTRKGTRAEQWLPASSEAFVWLRLYLADLGAHPNPNEPLWQSRRRRRNSRGELAYEMLSYDGLRKVVMRANDKLGTNWTMHDLRHTAALRMSRDENLSARDVQTILGHAHLSTTSDIYLVEDQAAVIERVRRHLAHRDENNAPPFVEVSAGYERTDLEILFGGPLP